jgi:hypothetical protein
MGTRRHMLLALIIREGTMVEGHGRVRRGRDTRPLTAAFHEAHNLAQPLECEQRRWGSWGRINWRACIVGRTHSECGVGPIREPHDEVRISPLPDPNQCDTLAAERVMRMGNGH